LTISEAGITIVAVMAKPVRPAPETDDLTDALHAFDRFSPEEKDMFLKAGSA
jgi:hypothetical protein